MQMPGMFPSLGPSPQQMDALFTQSRKSERDAALQAKYQRERKLVQVRVKSYNLLDRSEAELYAKEYMDLVEGVLSGRYVLAYEHRELVKLADSVKLLQIVEYHEFDITIRDVALGHTEDVPRETPKKSELEYANLTE